MDMKRLNVLQILYMAVVLYAPALALNQGKWENYNLYLKSFCSSLTKFVS